MLHSPAQPPRSSGTAVPRRVAAAAITVLVAVVVLLAACSPTADSPSAAPLPGAVAPPASPTATASPPAAPSPPANLIDYAQITGLSAGVLIREPDTVDALSGAPDDFRAYLAAQIATLVGPSDCPVSIGVQRVRTDGFAVGTVTVGTIRGCETAGVVWAKGPHGWFEVSSGPEPDCAALEQYQVPAAISGSACVDDEQNALTPNVTTGPAGLQVYTNARFGFRCHLPGGWKLAESTSAGGVTATDPTAQATASCFGRNTLGDGTTADELENAGTVLRGAGVDVTYEHLTDTTYVLSGIRPDGSITYIWSAVGPGSVNSVVWSYPAGMKSDLDAAVTTSVHGFERGDLQRAH